MITRLQIDNTVTHMVFLVVSDTESCLEIYDRKTGERSFVPVARKKIPVKVHYYRSHWLYRLYSGTKYGHVNIELPENKILNYDLEPTLCGILHKDLYPILPDKTIETYTTEENIIEALKMVEKPLSLWTILKKNCFIVTAKCLGGSNKKTVTNLLKGN